MTATGAASKLIFLITKSAAEEGLIVEERKNSAETLWPERRLRFTHALED